MARSELDIILRVKDKGSKTLSKFNKTFLAMAAAAGAAKIAGEAWQAAIAGSQMIKAERSFASMAQSVGQDINEIAEAMQEASGGAVSMQKSMELASQAIRLGVATTPEEFAKLTKAAANLGAAMGRGPVEAMEDIVRGIGRMSPLILDNIGIMTNGGKVFEDYAKTIGKTASQLTDAEKKQALLNKAIEDGNKLTDAAATGFEKLDASLADLKNKGMKELSEEIEPLVDKFAGWLADLLKFRRSADELGLSGRELAKRMWEIGETSKDAREKIIAHADAMGLAARQADELMLRLAGIEPAQKAVVESTTFLDVATRIHTEGLTLENIAAWEQVSALQAQKKALDDLAGGLRAMAPMLRGGFSMWEDVGGGPGFQHGGTFTVPPGFPNDSFPMGVSSGEKVSVQNDERQFFGNSTVNISNGTGLDAFEELLRTIQ